MALFGDKKPGSFTYAESVKGVDSADDFPARKYEENRGRGYNDGLRLAGKRLRQVIDRVDLKKMVLPLAVQLVGARPNDNPVNAAKIVEAAADHLVEWLETDIEFKRQLAEADEVKSGEEWIKP